MAVSRDSKHPTADLLPIPISDSVSVDLALDANLLGQRARLEAGYTPLPKGDALWRLHWRWDLGDETLGQMVNRLFDKGQLLEGLSGIRPGPIEVAWFKGAGDTGLWFEVADRLGFLYLHTASAATCCGLVYPGPKTIETSGVLKSFLGPSLTVRNLCIGYVSGNLNAPTRERAVGQLRGVGPLLDSKEPLLTGLIAGATLETTHGSLALPFPELVAKKSPDTPVRDDKPAGSNQPKESGASMRKWFNLNKTIGPLCFARIGCEWKNGKIGILMDSSVELGPLHLGLTGLKLSVPPFDLKIGNVELDLEGIDVSLKAGPVTISGAFLKSDVVVDGQKTVQYDGMAMIKAFDLTIIGFGSYASVAGQTSLFVFAILHKTLGGPIAFVVKGLAAGFGYNRKLTLPPIEEVEHFPLVRASLNPDYLSDKPGDAMVKLREYIPPSLGDYWFACGIRFSSFEMIDATVLVSVSFGHEVEIGLLGMAEMTIPKGIERKKALAYAALALRAVIQPTQGKVAIEGRLTSESFIFSKDCHLTGGFAFYLWFRGEHAGDFVLTLGGYHPAYNRPTHYPLVPRLGIHWQVTNELVISSELYFALTPSCLMAGGRLSAVYQSSCIKAWFIAYADFLIGWQPFCYSIAIGISIGIEVRLRIPLGFCSIAFSLSVHLSVGLEIWGPEFSGRLSVDLGVITLSIAFGGSKATPEPLKGDIFFASCLPRAEEGGRVITAQVSNGLLRPPKEKNDFLGVVNAHELILTIRSAIPVTSVAGKKLESSALGIRPMARKTLSSELTLIIKDDKGKEVAGTTTNLGCKVIPGDVPDALWGQVEHEGKVCVNRDSGLLKSHVGVQVSFDPKAAEGPLPEMAIEKLGKEDIPMPIFWDDALKAVDPETLPQGFGSLMEHEAKRSKVHDALARQGWPFTPSCNYDSANNDLRLSSYQVVPKPLPLGAVLR